jgi:Holliday junction resolvase RusA-like endonuclease|tara:strand:+ start:3714 stop:4175 length:462 start_codon:yes stop_codon:yes gene_type:complete
MIKLICPLYIVLERKTKPDKKIFVNMNTYRNLHFQINNQVKVKYKELLKEQLVGVKIKTPVEITYKVYKARNNNLDKMNVVSITSKYLLDAITEFGCWTDDNDDFVKTETIMPTELDRDKPRVEVFIKSINERFRKDCQESQAVGEDGSKLRM